MSIKVLALDLERTLIDDALSGQPRPGLRNFLLFCHLRFGRVAIYTTVETADAREVIEELNGRGCVPEGLLDRLEFIDWRGEFKDLTFVPAATPAEILLVDDDGGWVRPDQQDRWISIAPWDGGADSELTRVRGLLEDWLTCEQRPGDER